MCISILKESCEKYIKCNLVFFTIFIYKVKEDLAMATKKQALKEIEKLRCTLQDDDHTLYVDAPKGKVFGCNNCHCLCYPCSNNGGQSWRPEVYSEIVHDLKTYGLIDCVIPDCEICYK